MESAPAEVTRTRGPLASRCAYQALFELRGPARRCVYNWSETVLVWGVSNDRSAGLRDGRTGTGGREPRQGG